MVPEHGSLGQNLTRLSKGASTQNSFAYMAEDFKVLRHDAAEAGRAYLSSSLSWDEFMERLAGSKDELVSDLVDLIEHEPKRGGFLGVNEEQWARYLSQLSSAIAALESGL